MLVISYDCRDRGDHEPEVDEGKDEVLPLPHMGLGDGNREYK